MLVTSVLFTFKKSSGLPAWFVLCGYIGKIVIVKCGHFDEWVHMHVDRLLKVKVKSLLFSVVLNVTSQSLDFN